MRHASLVAQAIDQRYLMLTAKQFIKFAVVGLISNGVLYLAYLLLTWVGPGPKIAMTILYAMGTAQTFIFNHRWTFGSSMKYGPAFFRYVVTYVSGYLINLAVLVYLVDHLALPHQAVQGGVILTLAVYIFLLQKFWVFRAGKPDITGKQGAAL
jgi:putative flippase GtrA